MTIDSDLIAQLCAPDPALPEDALDMMRLSLFDWAVCGRAGVDEPVARIVRDMVLAEGGSAQAVLFGGGTAPARGAALVNGTISHALDYDDTHFAHIGHPSVAVCPAVLAVGQSVGSSQADMLAAALIGVEASVRIGVWLGRGHYQIGFHQTATAGCFGATLAAARLLGCDLGQIGHALGLAATRASGLKVQFGTMGKPYNAGLAAANGVECALLARAGMTSRPDALSSDLGFGATHHGAGAPVGDAWLFPGVSHKFHACCHGLHAMLEALGELRTEVAPEQVARIEIETHSRWLSVCNQPAPETGLGAKFSYSMTAAMCLAGHSTAALDSFSDAACANPVLVGLRDLVRVTGDDSLAETAARVRLTLRDGTVRDGAHDLSAPMAQKVRADKLRTKAVALLGAEMAEALWRDVQRDDLRRLVG